MINDYCFLSKILLITNKNKPVLHAIINGGIPDSSRAFAKEELQCFK